VLVATENGYGKRTKAEQYRLQKRGGSGVINIKTSERNGRAVGMMTVSDTDEVVLITTGGKIIRSPVSGISVIGRNTQGVRLISLKKGDKVGAIALAGQREENGEANGPDETPPEDKESPTQKEPDESQ